MKHFLHGSKQPVSKALIVLISMLLTPLAVMAQTGFWTDEGNYDKTWPSAEDIDGDYYNIRNEADLAAFANLVNTGKETFKGKIVRVYNTHIDLADHYWIPIGWNEKNKFEGTFDGMEHRFENVCIDVDELNAKEIGGNRPFEELGFFGYNYGTIRNVSLQSMQIRGTGYSSLSPSHLSIGGVVVHNMEGAVIENCIIFDDPAKVTEQPSLVQMTEIVKYIGGICMENKEGATIRNCRNDKPIRMEYANLIAGIVCTNYGVVSNCSNSKELRADSNTTESGYYENASIGGIAYDNRGEITNCINEGTVYGDFVGGIVGSNSGMCSGNQNTGAIESRDRTAGICISNSGTCVENSNSGHIIGISAAGIIYENNSGELTDCTNSGRVEGFSSAAGIACEGGSIRNCINTGKITVTNDGTNDTFKRAEAGGICASGGDSVYNCINKGEVTVSCISLGYAGGIEGYLDGKGVIAYCYNTAPVSVSGGGKNDSRNEFGVGGIVGAGGVTINNCFNTGDISCVNKETQYFPEGRVGGLIGRFGIISNSYNTGNVYSNSEKVIAGAYGIGGTVTNSFNTGDVKAIGTIETTYDKETEAYGIGRDATCCLSLGKSITSTNIAYKVGANTTEQGNYASSLLKIKNKDGDCSSLEGVDANGDHGRFWKPDMIAPIDAWPTESWDKSDNTILPQLKYADGTLMPDQPRLLRSDYAGDAPTVSVKMAYNGFDRQYIGAGETVERSMSPIYFDVPSLDQDYRIVLEMENADKLAINYGEGPFGDMNPLAFTDGKATILKSECRIDTEGGKMRVIPYLDIMAEEAGDYPYTIKVYDETGTTCYAEFPSVFKAVVPVSLTTEKIEGNILAGVPFDIQIAGAGTFSGKEVSLRMFMNYHVDDSLTLTYQDSKVPFVKENEDYMNTGLDIALTDQVYLFTLTGKKATTSDQAYLSFALYHEDRMIPTAGSSWAPLSLSSSFIIDETGSKVEDEIVDEITIAENTTESTDTLDVKLSGVTTGKLTINAEAIAKVEISGTNDFGEVTNNGTFILNAAIEAEVNLTYTTIVNNGVFADSTGLVTEVGGEAGLAIGEIRQQASAGSTITLTATATPGGDYISVVFTWQMLVNGEWATLESNQKAVAKSISQLRVSEPVTDTYTANAEDEGLYRCVITSKVSEEVSTTLVSMAEIKSASDPDPDPDPTPDPDPEIPTGVKQTEDGSLRVWAADRQLHIQSPKAETAYIVSFNGQTNMLAVPVGETIVNMPQGSYIIHIGKQSYKLKF
ncbi:hypothetical protein [Parabacteroides sp.]|uniref:hypothetical protein n=1 Tax=Parabacteroides sp. TaxID=1869337 RepID=UPI00257D99CF|nr:hypothetical protein [Parabacteroides sp.]